MKKLTYILLFIWNIGIGQEASEDTTISIWTNEAFEVINTPTTISVLPIGINHLGNKYQTKYDTVKAVFVVCDSLEIASITEQGLHKQSIYDERIKWLYGYVVLKKEYGYVSYGWTRKEELGTVLGNEMRYEPVSAKTIGYLDLSKIPISKEIIIWDYKIIE